MHHPRRLSRAVLLAASALTAGFLKPHAQEGQSVPGPKGTHTENGLAGYAKILCSGVFVSGRAPEDVARGSAYFFMPREEQEQVKWTIDRDAKLARASFGNVTREARYYGDQGCIIQNPDKPGIHFKPVAVKSQLPDASTQAWPMGDRADTSPLPAGIDRAKLDAATDAEIGRAHVGTPVT